MMRCFFVTVHLLLMALLFPVTGNAQVADTAIHVTVQGNKIYNDNTLIGSFVQRHIDDLTYLQIYGNGSAEIAEATHAEGDSTWTIVTPVDQNKTYDNYDLQSPLPQLFKYLILRKYL